MIIESDIQLSHEEICYFSCQFEEEKKKEILEDLRVKLATQKIKFIEGIDDEMGLYTVTSMVWDRRCAQQLHPPTIKISESSIRRIRSFGN